MKAGWMSMFAILASLIAAPLEQDDWQKKTLSLTIAIHGDEMTERFEYVWPNRFFYNNNQYIVTGSKAEKQFHKLFQDVRLTEKSSLESLMEQMKNSGYETINRLEIRWLTTKEELYTWIWDSEQIR